MRIFLLAALVGAALAALGFYLLRQHAIAPILGQVDYHFRTCVFGTNDFPGGDVDNGRLLRRMFVPLAVTTRFFDAGFREVTRAEKPGRYGAVVQLRVAGGPATYRFITLYRTPSPVRGDFVNVPITAQLPLEFGLDSEVVARQRAEIGAALQHMLIDHEESRSPESVSILLAALAEMKPNDPPAHLHDGPEARNAAWWYALQSRLGLAPEYPCLVDLPRGYDADPARRWPLILFLHSADKGGGDSAILRTCALPKLIAAGRQVPAVVVSPQCPEAQSWNMPVLAHLLDTVSARYRVDPDRIYLTGISAGGDITWDLALLEPGRFAAIVPMSGESDPADAARLRSVPVWGFSGGRDEIVPPAMMQAMTDAVRQTGGSAHLTIFPDAGHDCWDEAYGDEALWTWLFAQKRGLPEVRTPGTPVP